jgi:PAS domain S-box-containing protein
MTAPTPQITATDVDRIVPRSRRRRLALVLAVVVCGGALSLSLYGVTAARERQLAAAQFKLDAGRRVETIRREVVDRVGVVDALAAFYAGSQTVERNEFRTFTGRLTTEHRETYALAWAPIVGADKRAAHEEAARKEGYLSYQITERNARGEYVPAGRRDPYYPIFFIEPLREHRTLLGFDLGSNPACRAAIEQALATGQPAAAVFPPLADHDADSNQLYVFQPASTEDSGNGGRPSGQSNIDGLVLGVFRLGRIVEGALEYFAEKGIDVYIVDASSPAGLTPVYTHPFRLRDESSEPFPAALPETESVHYPPSTIQVADRTWSIYCVPIQQYLALQHTWGPVGMLWAGLAVTGLLAGYLVLLTGRTQRVQQLVAERTAALRESESRHRTLFESSRDALMTLEPPSWKFTSCNPATVKMFDVKDEAEFRSLGPWQVSPAMQPDGRPSVEKVPEMIETAMREGSHFFEWTHNRLNGKNFPATVLLTRMELAGQTVLQATVRDITAQKQAEEALHAEQRLLRELLNLQEHDRQLVAYEIHDGLAQQLTAAWFKFQSIEPLREKDPVGAKAMFDAALEMLRESLAETRRLIGGLRPPILDESGVVAAIDYLVCEQRQRGGPEIEFDHHVEFDRLAAPLEIAVFRIVQECLTNACRYSQSQKVLVELGQAGGRVLIRVQDWGIGFDPAQVRGAHFGLRGIRERARLLGGSATVEAAPAKGTRVIVELPLLTPQTENGTVKDP